MGPEGLARPDLLPVGGEEDQQGGQILDDDHSLRQAEAHVHPAGRVEGEDGVALVEAELGCRDRDDVRHVRFLREDEIDDSIPMRHLERRSSLRREPT